MYTLKSNLSLQKVGRVDFKDFRDEKGTGSWRGGDTRYM